jgi:hypothetical protein
LPLFPGFGFPPDEPGPPFPLFELPLPPLEPLPGVEPDPWGDPGVAPGRPPVELPVEFPAEASEWEVAPPPCEFGPLPPCWLPGVSAMASAAASDMTEPYTSTERQ